MEYPIVTSRKNQIIAHIRKLASDKDYRDMHDEYVLDGHKLLDEARENGAEITKILWSQKPETEICVEQQIVAPPELVEYASPAKSSEGPVFTVKKRKVDIKPKVDKVIILENVQDPGNVGTILRTASAFGIDIVLLTGACADPWSPKAARASMGACFKQNVIVTDIQGVSSYLKKWSLPLYAATTRGNPIKISELDLCRAAVAIGNEGSGLSEELISICDSGVVIPMLEGNESLNAAVAASIIMWEMRERT